VHGRFTAGLEAFVASLPERLNVEFERGRTDLRLAIPAPSSAHRTLSIEAAPGDIDFELGEVWGEFDEPDYLAARTLLAWCDAIRDGRVREVRFADTGAVYQIARLRSHGLDAFSRVSSFGRGGRRRAPYRVSRLAPYGAAS
jgi:hypothetical protein